MKADNKNTKQKNTDKREKQSNPQTENKRENKGHFAKTIQFLQSERTHYITGLIILVTGLFLFVSFLSFFFTGDLDQSKLAHLPFSQLTDVKKELQNWAGSLGALLRNYL